LVPIPPIVANVIIVPLVLRYAYGAPDAIPFMMATVGAGEIISCYVLGMLNLLALKKFRGPLFEKH
ncbi:MAG: QueT transporter family protein, partial [Eubacterium sp.]|nr:QueT transporter family protein [Eubacterium sp.]